MREETRDEFAKKVRFKRLPGRPKSKINNSYGQYAYYLNWRRVRPEGERFNIKWDNFSKILHSMNQLMIEEMFNSGSVELPYSLGSLVICSWKREVCIKDGRLKIPYIVDWEKTLTLWYEDEEAHQNKTKVYFENKNNYIVRWETIPGKYKNQYFYNFKILRRIKQEVAKRATNNTLDNFFIKY